MRVRVRACALLARDMSSPMSPTEFGCAFFLDTFTQSTLFGGTATGTMAPFCATMTEASSGVPVDYAALWAKRTDATGGTFFPGVKGAIDLTGGYSTKSATWTEGGNIGGATMISGMALMPDFSDILPADDVPTESVAPIFVFSEGKVCYDSPPLWNGMYPDTTPCMRRSRASRSASIRSSNTKYNKIRT